MLVRRGRRRTLFTIAKDVKIQVEFNPGAVAEYRLIGYETRALNREDFNNDKVDAGEIGSGHTVTAIYEITPVGAPKLRRRSALPEAGDTACPRCREAAASWAFLKIRYKLPDEDTSKLITAQLLRAMEQRDIQAAPEDVRFSMAVAAFGQMLRGEPYTGGFVLRRCRSRWRRLRAGTTRSAIAPSSSIWSGWPSPRVRYSAPGVILSVFRQQKVTQSADRGH